MKLSFTQVVKDEIIKRKVKGYLPRVFVECGMITNPELGHRVEFRLKSLEDANNLILKLSDNDIPGKLSLSKRNVYLVYLVDVRSIVSLLMILGVKDCLDYYNEVAMYKDMIKDTNRQVNFELANIKKSSEGSVRQLNSINKLLKKYKLKDLDEDIALTIKYRKKYPDISLTDLAKKMKISKSALNHRLIKIRNMIKS